MNDITIRHVKTTDRPGIEKLLGRIREFSKEELACALELCESAMKNGNNDEDYAFLCAEDETGSLVGFLCYGKTPLTRSAYDLYWVVTDPGRRRSGIGSSLLRHLEDTLKKKGASLLVAETSSLPAYAKARTFYIRQGFQEESRIRDFYAPGDDRLIYCKRYGVRPSSRRHPGQHTSNEKLPLRES